MSFRHWFPGLGESQALLEELQWRISTLRDVEREYRQRLEQLLHEYQQQYTPPPKSEKPGTVRVPGHYPTLTEACKAIDYPCTIIVDELTPLRLDGGDYRHIRITAQKPLTCKADNIIRLVGCKSPHFRGIEIDATGSKNAFLCERQSDLYLEDVTVRNAEKAAVDVRHASTLLAVRLTAENCVTSGSASQRHSAVSIHRASLASLESLTINGSGWNGVQVALGAVAHIRRSTIRDCVSYGVRATNGGTANVEGCEVHDCQRAGIYSSYGSNINARASKVSGTGPRQAGLPNANNAANFLAFGGGFLYAGERCESGPVHRGYGVHSMTGARITISGARLSGSGARIQSSNGEVWR